MAESKSKSDPADTPKGERYFFPEHTKIIYADSISEAEEKLAEELKADKETEES